LKPLDQIPSEARACIKGLKIVTTNDRDGRPVSRTVHLKLESKLPPLRTLAEMHAMGP